MIRQALILSAVLIGGCDKPREVDPWEGNLTAGYWEDGSGWQCVSGRGCQTVHYLNGKPCLGRIENNRCIRRVEINGAMRNVTSPL